MTSGKSSLEDLTKMWKTLSFLSLKAFRALRLCKFPDSRKSRWNSLSKTKMKEYGLDEDTVKKVIQGSDVNTPLGLYTFGNKEKSVVVNGDITSIKDLKDMRIPVTSSSAAQGQAGGAGAASAADAQAMQQAQQSASAGCRQSSFLTLPTLKM